MGWYLNAIDIAPGLNFCRDISRNIVRPMLKRIEGDNSDRVIELALQKVTDDGFEVRPLNFTLAVDGAVRPEAIYNEVGRLISAIGHDSRFPICSRHRPAPANEKLNLARAFGSAQGNTI
jgi:hypothetical protein